MPPPRLTDASLEPSQTGERAGGGLQPGERRMRLRYGVNEPARWWHFAEAPEREHLWARLREMDTRIIRVPVFTSDAPDPITEWPVFASYLQAVLSVGAVPMITFAGFPPPFDRPASLRYFARRCADVVWKCVEQWGGEIVRDWYWCVWDRPNSDWVSPGMHFEQYRQIYEEVAHGVVRWLLPYLNGRRVLIGGPAIDGFQPFWVDWVWRFVNEIDNSLIGFASWHRYGDWRVEGEWGAPGDEHIYRALLLSRTIEYGLRAKTVSRMLSGRQILNICDELTAHAHHETHVSMRFNQTMVGAAYYVSALLHLMWGGTDAEMLWTGTSNGGPVGIVTDDGRLTPVFYAKKLCAEYVRYGDTICFPAGASGDSSVEVVVARAASGHKSVLIVHLKAEPSTFDVSELTTEVADCDQLLKIDDGTGHRIVETRPAGVLRFEGYGVAVLTNVAPRHELTGGFE